MREFRFHMVILRQRRMSVILTGLKMKTFFFVGILLWKSCLATGMLNILCYYHIVHDVLVILYVI